MTTVKETAKQSKTKLGLRIEKLYTTSASLAVSTSPVVFKPNMESKYTIDIKVSDGKSLKNDLYESTLYIKLIVSLGDKEAYTVEASQTGIFSLTGFNEEQLKQTMAVHCSSILYPYLREVLTDLGTKAGFPHLYLAPINFQALYESREEKVKS